MNSSTKQSLLLCISASRVEFGDVSAYIGYDAGYINYYNEEIQKLTNFAGSHVMLNS